MTALSRQLQEVPGGFEFPFADERAFRDHVDKIAGCRCGRRSRDRHVILRAEPALEAVNAFREQAQQRFLLPRVLWDRSLDHLIRENPGFIQAPPVPASR